MTDLFQQFQRRFGGLVAAADREFVEQAILDAGNCVCDLTGRETVPERLIDVQIELAIIAYNKRGAEGESSRSEGGISRAFEDLSPLLQRRLLNYPRKVGVIRAVNADESEDGAVIPNE